MDSSTLLLECQRRLGSPAQVVAQSPGRINLMGRHTDHQGGDVNMLAMDRYIWVAAGRRQDSTFRFRNLEQGRYPDFDFDLSQAEMLPGADWEQTVNDPRTIRFRERIPLWCRYLVGAALRLAREKGAPLPGLDILVYGDLPPAAGLSSSSALVLSTIMAADALFQWRLSSADLVRLTSEAERLSGTKGGTSDPAAMLASKPGCVVQLGCLPFQVKGVHRFPPDLRIILANSHESAAKGAGARNDYNWRVAAYRMARLVLYRLRPQWKERMPHLRDLHPDSLGVGLADIYRAVKELPQHIRRDELLESYPGDRDQFEEAFLSHTMPESGYPLRDILVYGLGEMARARRFGELLDREDYGTLARWVNLSHDGDRVSRLDGEVRRAWRPPVLSDAELGRLIRLAERNDPRGDLAEQTGAYLCSTPNVDEMVDLCLSVEGCLGAQILGAGLGGCMMALAKSSAEAAVIETLKTRYFEPCDLPLDIWSVAPGSGARVEKPGG